MGDPTRSRRHGANVVKQRPTLGNRVPTVSSVPVRDAVLRFLEGTETEKPPQSRSRLVSESELWFANKFAEILMQSNRQSWFTAHYKWKSFTFFLRF